MIVGSIPAVPVLDSLAQLVEQRTFNPWVTGSNPVRVIQQTLGKPNNCCKQKTSMHGNYRQGYNRTFGEDQIIRWTSSHYDGVRLSSDGSSPST